ncbi:MAG TPA: DinB family protein [Thermomicrobiales bacterium]|jgi:uncharacterized damage-inducible protein DinB
MMTDGILFNLTRNMVFLHEKSDGLTHAESLLQAPFPGNNCLNWTVGHIAAFRNRMLQFAGVEPTLDAAIAERYAPNSAPVLGDEPGIGQLADLLRAIDTAQERLITALPTISPERAAEVVDRGMFTMKVGEWLLFLLRHEAYHIGQLHFPYSQAIASRDNA